MTMVRTARGWMPTVVVAMPVMAQNRTMRCSAVKTRCRKDWSPCWLCLAVPRVGALYQAGPRRGNRTDRGRGTAPHTATYASIVPQVDHACVGRVCVHTLQLVIATWVFSIFLILRLHDADYFGPPHHRHSISRSRSTAALSGFLELKPVEGPTGPVSRARTL